jgi:hypothetical protein
MTDTGQETTGREPQVERRKNTRYQLRGTAWFQWETAGGERREGVGVTRDISKAGLFIETTELPLLGARVKVVVTIAGGTKDDLQVRLCGAGDVRHVQRDEKPASGFGAWAVLHTEGRE